MGVSKSWVGTDHYLYRARAEIAASARLLAMTEFLATTEIVATTPESLSLRGTTSCRSNPVAGNATAPPCHCAEPKPRAKRGGKRGNPVAGHVMPRARAEIAASARLLAMTVL